MSDSPFMAGTRIQWAWDSTSLGWYKTCPRLYQYNMIEGYRSKAEAVHLIFGIWYHGGLELYDRLRAEGQGHDDALREVVLDLLTKTWIRTEEGGTPWVSPHNTKTRENLIRSVIWYVEHFIEDPAETIVLSDGRPAVELSFRMEISDRQILCGHLDRLVTFTGNTYVMDRKTTGSTIGSSYFDQYSPDNQMSLYTMAGKVIYHVPVRGVIIEAAQIAVGFTRFARGFTYRTDAELSEWLDETKDWIARSEADAKRNYWPRNDKSCHHYGGCVFRGVCSKSPDVRQKFIDADFTVSHWNPLTEREAPKRKETR